VEGVVVAEDELVGRERHVVAEVVKTELGVGDVGDVGEVGGAALGGRGVVLDGGDFEPKPPVDRPHPLGVAAGEVVVHGDEVHALAGKGV